MISAIELKKCVVGASILGIVVSKLYHGKKLCPIILLEVDKGSEVGFHCAILSFDLTIRLWVEGDGEPLLDAKEIA